MLLLASATTFGQKFTADGDGIPGGKPMRTFGISERKVELPLRLWIVQSWKPNGMIPEVQLSWKRKCIAPGTPRGRIGGRLPGDGFDPAGQDTGPEWKNSLKRWSGEFGGLRA